MPPAPDDVATYHMLGRSIRVEYDGSRGSDILRSELSRYPATDEPAHLTVHYGPVEAPSPKLVNPRIHVELKDGFVMRQRMADVRFGLKGSNLLRVDFRPASASSRLLTQARRLLDIQHTSREERAGMIFHEMVLVPAAHWMAELAVVHASAFSDEHGAVTMIGGTGGVGKTSLALELCLKHGFRFLADDISFIAEDGHVWPNLAYPKIYAYNLEGNPDLAARVLGGRGIGDRVHWAVHRRRGAQFVRRRVAPDVLYGSYDRDGGPLRRYVILTREDRSGVDVSELPAARAAALSTALMPPEYHQFHNHLYWHAFNRGVTGDVPSIAVADVLRRWESILARVFEGAICLLVRLPVSMEHLAFKETMAGLLRDSRGRSSHAR